MAKVHANTRAEVHMRGKGLLRSTGALHNKTHVATFERGVIITASCEKVMHTNASNRVIGATKLMTLEDAVTDGAVITIQTQQRTC